MNSGYRIRSGYVRFFYAEDYELAAEICRERMAPESWIEAYIPGIGWTRNFERPTIKPSGTEARVCEDIVKRQQRGIAKYRTTVADNPLSVREWLTHAYEECLDEAVYLKRAIEGIDKDDNDCDMCGGVRNSSAKSATHEVDLG